MLLQAVFQFNDFQFIFIVDDCQKLQIPAQTNKLDALIKLRLELFDQVILKYVI